MSHSCKRHASWSNLDGEIIRNISNHLQSREEILCFKLVCKKWKEYSIPLPRNILSLILPLTIPMSTNNTLPFHDSTSSLVLQENSIFLITPSHPSQVSPTVSPWMIMVEESNPGKVRLRHCLTSKRVNNFPPTLDLNLFRATELAQGYSFKGSDCIQKVLLCPSSSPTSLDVMVLYLGGVLGKLTVRAPECQARSNAKEADAEKEEEEVEAEDENKDEDEVEEEDEEEEAAAAVYCWKKLEVRRRYQFWFRFLDDIVKFKEKYCAIDRKGKLYEIDTNEMMVANVLVSAPICRGDLPSQRRKRLVVDPTLGELHLVVRECRRASASFVVYKFNEQCKKWDVIENLGRDRVLFVGLDHCFFAKATEFPGRKGNCIVFPANCFTQYNGRNAPDGSLFCNEDVEVGLYRLGKGDNFKLLSSAYSEFSKSIWPPPTWFFPKSECNDKGTDSGSSSSQGSDEGNSSSQKSLSDDHTEGMLTDSSDESSSDEDEDEAMLLDSSSSKPSKASDRDEITNSDEDDGKEGQKSPPIEQPCEFKANSSASPMAIDYEEHIVGTPKVNYQKREECSGPDFSEETVHHTNSTPVTPAELPTSSIVKFEGVDVKSELLPTLQTIWEKHGSLISEDTVRSKQMQSCALESVARLVITLQNTTGRSLTDSQAEEIRSTVSDLQRVGLKVDWLVPIVEKTLKLLRRKPLIESIMLLDKKKAQVDKEEKEFLARTAKVKQEIEENVACLSARIPSSEIIDLDDCLGSGLF